MGLGGVGVRSRRGNNCNSINNENNIKTHLLETALPGFRSCNPPMVKAESELGP